MGYTARIVTPPTVEPVSLAEAKLHCNVVATDEDTLITDLIVAAREMVEEYCSRALLSQTWAAKFSEWPESGFYLPRPPLSSVSSIKYYDANGAEQTLSSTYYRIDTNSQPGRVWWDDDYTLPTLDDREWPVTVTYVAGYAALDEAGTSSSSSGSAWAVPHRAKQAILLLVGHWYRVREAVGRVEGEVELAFRALCRSLKAGVYP